MSTYELGRIGLNPRGEYSATETYEKLDVVNYEGSSYIAKASVTGVAPTAEDSWELLASGFPAAIDNITDLYRLGIQCGRTSSPVTLPAGEVTNITITFPLAYKAETEPIVVPVFWTGSTAAKMAQVSVVAFTTTNTQFIARCFNSSSYDRTPRIQWIAIGIPDPDLIS